MLWVVMRDQVPEVSPACTSSARRSFSRTFAFARASARQFTDAAATYIVLVGAAVAVLASTIALGFGSLAHMATRKTPIPATASQPHPPLFACAIDTPTIDGIIAAMRVNEF
jgi:anti-sigma-K factor RskA